MSTTALVLRPAYVAVIDRRDPVSKISSRHYVSGPGTKSPDCLRAFASRDRAAVAALIAGIEGGRVLEWVLSDGRING